MKKNLLSVLLGITLAATTYFGCSSEGSVESRKADYSLKRNTYSEQYFNSLSIDQVSGLLFRRRAESEAFKEKIFNEYHSKEELFKLWDSVAQSKFEFIEISNYFQEQAQKKNKIKKSNIGSLKEIEHLAKISYRLVLDSEFNSLNQQVKKGDSIIIKKWDSYDKKLKETKIKFEEELYVKTIDGIVQKPAPRKYSSEFDSEYIDARLKSEFRYNSNSNMDIRRLLAKIEMSSEAAYLLQK